MLVPERVLLPPPGQVERMQTPGAAPTRETQRFSGSRCSLTAQATFRETIPG